MQGTSSETTARGKHACPACGGEAQWNPAKQALVCPFCGTTAPGTLEPSGEIVEHDLVAALRRVPDEDRGWRAEKRQVKCQSCHAISVFDAEKVGKNCDFCGSSQIMPYEQVKAAFSPESVLPIKVSESKAREEIRAWYGKVWFAPNALKRRALTDTVKGVYLPYWTFDAQVHADWRAEAGHHYYTNETSRDSNGNVQTRRVQHTRWEPAWGSVDHFFDDELVPASTGAAPHLLRKIEPFPTNELVAYDPAFVRGWVVERYQIDLVAAAQRSRQTMDSKVRQMCSSEVPGDTQRNLQVNADYSRQTFKHILVPVWLVQYNYGAKNFQLLVNGATGQIAGEYPKSWIKITLLVLAILAFILAMVALSEKRRGDDPPQSDPYGLVEPQNEVDGRGGVGAPPPPPPRVHDWVGT